MRAVAENLRIAAGSQKLFEKRDGYTRGGAAFQRALPLRARTHNALRLYALRTRLIYHAASAPLKMKFFLEKFKKIGPKL